MHTLAILFSFLVALCSYVVAADAPPVANVAAEGKALLPIVISASASVETQARAAEFLTNEVARAVQAKHPGKLVGQLAYSFHSPESSDNWGPCGLGYYFAARLLWDVREAGNLDAIFEDFIASCFAGSQQPMRKFYRLINRSTPPASDDLVGRMYRLLRDAHALAHDDAEQARLADLVLYTRHVELWLDSAAAVGSARQTAIEAVLRHSSRIASTGMVHTLAVWQERWRGHDKGVKLPEEYRYRAPGENPWRSTEPFTAAELDRLVEQGIAHHAIADFEPHALVLKTTFTGLHRIEVADGRIGTSVESPAGRAFTIAYEFAEAADTTGKRDLYFYVPRGAKLVGGFAKGAGKMMNGSGAAVHQFGDTPGYFSVAVPPGEDGRLWQFANTGGQRVLLTVPPFLARNASELLLPREVVERDADF